MPVVVTSIVPWNRSTVAGTAATTPPQPLDHIGIIINNGEGYIEAVTEPNTAMNLSELRDQVISDSNGKRNMVLVEVAVGKLLQPGMSSSAILYALETVAARTRPVPPRPPSQAGRAMRTAGTSNTSSAGSSRRPR